MKILYFVPPISYLLLQIQKKQKFQLSTKHPKKLLFKISPNRQ